MCKAQGCILLRIQRQVPSKSLKRAEELRCKHNSPAIHNLTQDHGCHLSGLYKTQESKVSQGVEGLGST